MSNDVKVLANEELFALSRQLTSAKVRENAAKNTRIVIEEKISALVSVDPTKKQRTVKLTDGSSVIVKHGLNYKADVAAIKKVFQQLPPARVPIEIREVLNEKEYERYRKEEPEVFSKISQHVTVTPKKVSVTVCPPAIAPPVQVR